MTTEPFSLKLRAIMERYRPDFYANPFIQAMQEGQINEQALLAYVQQDHRYLDSYLPLYEEVFHKVTGQPASAVTKQDPKEYEAHQILLDLAGTSDASLQTGDYETLPTTRAYLDQLTAAAAEDDFVGLVALAACPFDYGYLADYLIRDGLIKPDNPFITWVGYYRGVEQSFTDQLLTVINRLAPMVANEVQDRALAEFERSTQYENAFFAQVMEETYA